MINNTMEIALIKDSKEEQKDFCFSIDFTIIRSVFPETRQVRIEDMENYLFQKLPIQVELTVLGSNAQNIRLMQPCTLNCK